MTRYTANEMRELAEMIDHGGAFALTDPSIVESNVAMLRQAADLQEREARERKYQYGVVFGGDGIDSDYIFDSEEYARTVAGDYLQVVRREVGEWEEIDNV